MKSFMVVKSFTLLNYFMNGKEKQEKKRTLLRLLQRSCFVTVSCVCRYFCWGPLNVEGPGNRFRVCATSPHILLPSSPVPGPNDFL